MDIFVFDTAASVNIFVRDRIVWRKQDQGGSGW